MLQQGDRFKESINSVIFKGFLDLCESFILLSGFLTEVTPRISEVMQFSYKNTIFFKTMRTGKNLSNAIKKN